MDFKKYIALNKIIKSTQGRRSDCQASLFRPFVDVTDKDEEVIKSDLSLLSSKGYQYFTCLDNLYPVAFRLTKVKPFFFVTKGNVNLLPANSLDDFLTDESVSFFLLSREPKKEMDRVKRLIEDGQSDVFDSESRQVINLYLFKNKSGLLSLSPSFLSQVMSKMDVRVVTAFNLDKIKGEVKDVVDYVVSHNGLVVSVTSPLSQFVKTNEIVALNAFLSMSRQIVYVNFDDTDKLPHIVRCGLNKKIYEARFLDL